MVHGVLLLTEKKLSNFILFDLVPLCDVSHKLELLKFLEKYITLLSAQLVDSCLVML